MKITFITPPTIKGRAAERLFGCTYQVYPQPNLVVLYTATILKNKGHEVVIRDMPVEGLSFNEYIAWAKQDNSDIYCFHTVPLCAELDLKAVKYLNQEKSVIWFGPRPTSDPKEFLVKENYYVIRGEAEAVISKVVDAIDKKINNTPNDDCMPIEQIPGLSHKKENQIITNVGFGYIKDINKLPTPDRSLIHYKKYTNPKLPGAPYTTMLTSRQCNAKCWYCVPNSLSYARELEWKRCNKNPECIKPPVTIRDPENIRKELEEIKALGIKAISVIDDQFVWGKERHLEVCRHFKEVGLPFGILARNDRLVDEEMVKALADAGCVYVDFGVESFSQEILDDVGKEIKVETIEKSIDLLIKYGIEPKLNILYGASPLETKETLKETLDRVLKLNIDLAQFAVCSPFPGTRFREKALQEGWVVEKDVGKADPSKKSIIQYPHLSSEYLTKWVKHSYRKFYFRPKIIAKRVAAIKRPGDTIVYLKGLWQLTK
ncbi:radical SAM protein [Candidatus Woesearchaeota archaeon]|jgi:anaerobic magnesium-protoporphyrin IX monomethyl ester cyclase|nr:radical SAM protein [Candidatus Woesearchaeota archaeon]MBT5273152.1 radical SAM protein [Candidatus Woesearchaeota archaeon]MBT6041615.1 radical SAM protein [Candidatus Woesearchaeota archaeon]MBT6337533.1 radical SAM protein [Candidatus Woesearchaeota archaeon]MBT7927066.1 radical SAM protein [Candidatus Woesearchaeota archaeon]